MADEDLLSNDLGMVVDDKGVADIAWAGGEIQEVSGNANLRQALALRILVGRGELKDVGHARYGSYVPDLIGEPLDKANLELLRRFVRHALKGDPRVIDVTQVLVSARRESPGVAYVDARVKAVNDEDVELSLALDLG